jgi:hypothetical protein
MARALFRRDHHHHLAAFEARHRLDLAEFGDVGCDAVQKFQAKLLVGHFAATEAQGDFDLVALIEELQHRAHFHIIIVDISARTELDFLDLDDVLLFARFGFAFLGLVFILAEVHDFAHGRLGIGRDFDQIQPGLFGHLHGTRRRHDADILAVRADQADLWRPDAIIDARAGFALRRGVVGSAGYGGSPSNGCQRA